MLHVKLNQATSANTLPSWQRPPIHGTTSTLAVFHVGQRNVDQEFLGRGRTLHQFAFAERGFSSI